MPNATCDLDGDLLRASLAGANLGHVPEVGCGTGKNTQWLVQHAKVIGLDISPEMLASCRAVAPGAELRTADLCLRWPVDDGAVDTVLFNPVLEHIEDLAHIARETARVLRDGGRARVSELHPWLQHQGKAARFKDNGIIVETPTFVHTTEEYVTAFLNAGFALDSLSEPRAPSDGADRPPRMLVFEFSLRGR